jgi:hypothetical protein
MMQANTLEPGQRSARHFGAVWVLLALLCYAAPIVLAQEESKPEPRKRLFEKTPYDLVIVKDPDHKDRPAEPQRVLPLELPDGQVPAKPGPADKLRVRLFDSPDREYEILWRDIVSVRRFEQLVLAEAETLVSAGRFDEAYDYFDFLQRDYPRMPGLGPALHGYLLGNAKAFHAAGRDENALALLNQLYERNPRHDQLDALLGDVAGKLIEHYESHDQVELALALLQQLEAKYPKQSRALQWRTHFSSLAKQRIDEAKTDLTAERWGQAQTAALAALRLEPRSAEARALVEKIQTQYPRVVVGVTTPSSAAGQSAQSRLVDWSARRSGRLHERRLVEFVGAGSEGGLYECPVGALEKQNLGKSLMVRLRPGIRIADGGDLTGYRIARRLTALAHGTGGQGVAELERLMSVIEVRDVYELAIELRRSSLKSEAVLDLSLGFSEPAADQSAAPELAVYSIEERTPEQVRYRLQPDYFAAGAHQPREIVERHYRQSRDALAALERGDVSVVDRLCPWDLSDAQANQELTVVRYAVPTVHCLLANVSKPLPAQRAFRRAIEYGIERELILREHLLRNKKVIGCELLSGPFPRGTSFDDPLGYAYDPQIAPRPYDPRLAMTLATVAWRDASLGKADPKAASKKLPPLPSLVLAHPADEVARVACQQIQKHLKLIGLTLTLKELPAGSAPLLSSDHDLLYAELHVQEPLIDARALLGAEGLLHASSPYIALALDQLDTVESWKNARRKLEQIHQLAHDEAVVIPLWQLTEYLAYHKSLTGVGSEPVSLYQNVEQWKAGLRLPGAER